MFDQITGFVQTSESGHLASFAILSTFIVYTAFELWYFYFEQTTKSSQNPTCNMVNILSFNLTFHFPFLLTVIISRIGQRVRY
jgi:hypothetical protein